MKRLDHAVKYFSFTASAAALLWLAHAGLFPIKNPVRPDEYLVETDPTSVREQTTLRQFFRRQDVILALTFVFATAGPTFTLPNDFNTSSNQINGIGSGVAGQGGNTGSTCACVNSGGGGGVAGGGGGFSQIVNYSGHSAGQVVNVTVGTGDTIFDSSSILLAKAGLLTTGGQASAGVGTTKFSGGNGGTGGTGGNAAGGGGGGGGGAAGPHGAGNNGANGISNPSSAGSGGAGGTGDAGNTAAGANGTQFDSTHGSGGGGTGGDGAFVGNGSNGSNAGSYGAGGGGGGGGFGAAGSGGNGGNAFQGLIAIGYTPTAGATARSYGFIIS